MSCSLMACWHGVRPVSKTCCGGDGWAAVQKALAAAVLGIGRCMAVPCLPICSDSRLTSTSLRVASSCRGSSCVRTAIAALMKAGWSVTPSGAVSNSLDCLTTCAAGSLQGLQPVVRTSSAQFCARTSMPLPLRRSSAAVMAVTRSPCVPELSGQSLARVRVPAMRHTMLDPRAMMASLAAPLA